MCLILSAYIIIFFLYKIWSPRLTAQFKEGGAQEDFWRVARMIPEGAMRRGLRGPFSGLRGPWGRETYGNII